MVWSHIKAKSVAQFLFYSRSHTVPAWSRLIMSILWCGMKYNQAGACIVNTKICCQNIVMWFCQKLLKFYKWAGTIFFTHSGARSSLRQYFMWPTKANPVCRLHVSGKLSWLLSTDVRYCKTFCVTNPPSKINGKIVELNNDEITLKKTHSAAILSWRKSDLRLLLTSPQYVLFSV